MADLLCYRSFFSCKDNTLNVRITNINNNHNLGFVAWVGGPCLGGFCRATTSEVSGFNCYNRNHIYIDI